MKRTGKAVRAAKAAKHLRKHRKQAKLSQAVLANLIGKNVPYVRRLEYGRSPMNNRLQQRLAEIFKISVYELMRGTKPPPPKVVKVKESPRMLDIRVTSWGFYSRKALEFADQLHVGLKQIPRQYRKEAVLNLDYEHDYDDPPSEIVLQYRRPETSDEKRLRHSVERAKAKEAEIAERRTYERLREKFGK